jgi:hypothetical protein
VEAKEKGQNHPAHPGFCRNVGIGFGDSHQSHQSAQQIAHPAAFAGHVLFPEFHFLTSTSIILLKDKLQQITEEALTTTPLVLSVFSLAKNLNASRAAFPDGYYGVPWPVMCRIAF